MNNDDSLNDSDEIISLYGSKKVKETFKAQLQKIVSNSRNQKTNKEDLAKEKPNRNDQTEPKRGTVSTEISLPRSSTPKSPLEDSIEIISEFTPTKRTRHSERLRKKRGESISEINLSHDSPPRKHSKKSSKKSKNKKKQKGVPLIVLDDSVEPEEAEEDINPEISVKVIWKSVNVKKFQMRRFQKFSKIFELLSQEENIPEEKIMLTFNNTKVCRSDTPDTLNLQVYHFLDGGVLSELTNICESNSSLVNNTNKISLKFQDFNKKIVEVKIDRKDKMKVGMIKCSEQLEIPFEKIKFYFDGELLEPSETPESLGLDNDEIIDIKVLG